MAQNTGNSRNILVGASPLFISVEDVTVSGYDETMEPGVLNAFTANKNTYVPAWDSAKSYVDTLNAVDVATAATAPTPVNKGAAYRNVGYTNNGLQITYNPTYDSVTVDQLLDTAKLFKSAMEVMIATEMSEGTLENVLVVFGQKGASLQKNVDSAVATPSVPGSAGDDDVLYLAGGALGEAPTERQLIAVGQAPTTSAAPNTERVYYARRVLSVQQSQFSLARTTPTTFPVTFRLLPSGDSSHVGQEYGKIIDRAWTPA